MAVVLTVLGPIGDLNHVAAVRAGASLDMRQRRANIRGHRAGSAGSWHFLHIRTGGRRGSEAGIGEREGRSR